MTFSTSKLTVPRALCPSTYAVAGVSLMMVGMAFPSHCPLITSFTYMSEQQLRNCQCDMVTSSKIIIAELKKSQLTKAIHSMAVVTSLVSSYEHVSEASSVLRGCVGGLDTATDELSGFLDINQLGVGG